VGPRRLKRITRLSLLRLGLLRLSLLRLSLLRLSLLRLSLLRLSLLRLGPPHLIRDPNLLLAGPRPVVGRQFSIKRSSKTQK